MSLLRKVMHPFLVFSFILLLVPCSSYKMVLFVPNMANSQVLFNSRVAETLAQAGHDVTMVIIAVVDDIDSKDVKITKGVKIHRINASTGVKMKDFEEEQRDFAFEDVPVWDPRLREHINRMATFLRMSCRKMVENREFLNWLEAEKFDLAFSHMFDVCPIGLIHYAKIPSWIWLNSGALMDFVANYMGVPTIPSYTPPMVMESSDHMNFIERTKSLIGHTMVPFVWRRIFADGETAIFRELIGPDFPDLVDIAKKCPLVMVNSNELYDLPRPTLSKIVNIGGIGIQKKDAKPLSQEFQEIVDTAEGIVVFSFGTVAPSHKMPSKWKMAFSDAFKRFPRYHFLCTYQGTDLHGKISPNIHLFKWLPQSDLLQNPKTKAFISHGGYNSVQEAISAGVPMITIPLFGDQPKNAKIAEKHQFAVNIRKSDLSADTIADALSKILGDKSYSQKIRRLSQMVKKKPVSESHLLVSWAEFVAEFKILDNLVPAGNKLNFFQYHSLDVIAFLLLMLNIILYISWKLLKFVTVKLYLILSRSKKEKKA